MLFPTFHLHLLLWQLFPALIVVVVESRVVVRILFLHAPCKVLCDDVVLGLGLTLVFSPHYIPCLFAQPVLKMLNEK